MVDTFRVWAAVLLATLVALPVAVLVVVGLAVRRTRAGAPAGYAWTTASTEAGMVVGTLPWVWMILTPGTGPGGVELIPGRGLVDILNSGYPVAVVQIGGNLLVFAAFGLLAPIRWRLRPYTIAVVAASGSITVEALQYVLDLGRVSSVDDVALNTLGAVLATFLSRRWWRCRVTSRKPVARPQ